ncbi:helix-turn-helix domain-containing protein [Treponema denticola]|uniref:helix-turn-helix domain-containing protein n=1 Tax=Treponema denticola TaxID=158 RepID=UPI0020A5CA55|nr:helix-turn-helix domain-containing protein [Treponema denticola]UTC86862.1 helix-turn-helix domain-containing protein [Treponema denticola]
MLYSVTQAANLKNVCTAYMRKWASNNGCQKVGNSYLITEEDLQRFDNRNKKVGKPKKEK